MRTSPMAGGLCLAVATAAIYIASASDAVPSAAPAVGHASLTTQERMYDPGWWPTKGTPLAREFAGQADCAACHAALATVQQGTPMFHAAIKVASSDPLEAELEAKLETMTFHAGPYSYSFQKTASGLQYLLADADGSTAKEVAWAFGAGEIGQTYLLKNKDGYIESRLSFYSGPNALDVTTGHSEQVPASLQEALGHALTRDTAQRCFSCHSTSPVVAEEFHPDQATPGVTCEACHGPGAGHAAAMRSGGHDKSAAVIFDPSRLSPSDSVDFCGACHRTFSDVAVYMPPRLGVVSVRFQPYRLEKSRCWGKEGDARITCVACHDPHRPLVRDAAAYDAKCLACHTLAAGSRPGATAASCKVATNKCVSCHMPKYEVPQTHASFTDHDIRIVRADDRFDRATNPPPDLH